MLDWFLVQIRLYVELDFSVTRVWRELVFDYSDDREVIWSSYYLTVIYIHSQESLGKAWSKGEGNCLLLRITQYSGHVWYAIWNPLKSVWLREITLELYLT